jgi:regulatory protein
MTGDTKANTQSLYQNVVDKALKYLDRRAHTYQELLKKLKLKGFDKEIIIQALEELKEKKYIDDLQFARTFLENLIRYKTFGYYGLMVKLRQRGIEDSAIKELLEELLPIDVETEIAQRLLRKYKNLDKKKTAQILARKGFRTEVSRTILNI